MKREINIDIAASPAEASELSSELYYAMLDTGEVLAISKILDCIVDVEDKWSCQFSDAQIITAWNKAANNLCDAMIENAVLYTSEADALWDDSGKYQPKDLTFDEWKRQQEEYWHNQRPQVVRLRELQEKFKGV